MTDLSAASPAGRLTAILQAEDPTDGLWDYVNSGVAQREFPEFPALALEQDPIHRHKDVLAHTIAVTAKTPSRLRIRLAAVFHDIGKPATRRFVGGEVTFHNHEAVGAKITRRRMREMGFDDQLVAEVSQLVYLSGRFKGYADGWSDAAVRRYCRDAGPLLGDLNTFVRCDCTTRNPRKVRWLQEQMDDLERRIADLAREDARRRERPEIDGQRVMDHLGIGPGPDVGAALEFLLELKRAEGELGEEEVLRRLDRWWEARLA